MYAGQMAALWCSHMQACRAGPQAYRAQFASSLLPNCGRDRAASRLVAGHAARVGRSWVPLGAGSASCVAGGAHPGRHRRVPMS
jgi:hypothetical protein